MAAKKSSFKEKDYVAIARQRIVRPADIASFRRILVYGRNKKGKTRFGLSAGIPRTLEIDPERGTETMRHLNPYVWPISNWEDINEVYGALRTGELSPKTLGVGPEDEPFSWVSVDGLTRINNFALHYVRKIQEERDLDRQPGFVDRRDYGKSGELMKQMLTQFHTLPINIVYTAQERMMTDADGEEDEESSNVYYVPDLPASVRGTVNSLVEVIARIYTVRLEVPGESDGDEIAPKFKTERRLQIGIHEKYDTGYRSDFELPDMLRRPTIPKLTNLMLTGKAKNG